ncbi:MAG: hypothetical protein DRJ42_17475 [Deltaproteobacteria bacterium]|nr:MAG: hypothetical protein DRJ42_17475 [Deltaproteobacteria bacterium]
MNNHSRRFRHDVQGRVLGIPYDFRWPTLGKIASRVANPRSGMVSPKVWGWASRPKASPSTARCRLRSR